MLEIYSNNITVTANQAVPFENISVKKGCTATLGGTSTINLNKCGVYCVNVNASTEASTTLQLYKNGVAQAQAQSTGTNPGFTTLVQVAENNGGCACESPVSLQVVSTDAVTLAGCNCVVTKIC